MSERNERTSSLAAIITALVIVVLLLIGGGYAVFSGITVSGSTTTPSGIPVNVVADAFGFQVGSGAQLRDEQETTQVDIAGHRVEFGTSTIKVDGVFVGDIAENVKEISLTTSRKGLEILVDGKPLTPPE